MLLITKKWVSNLCASYLKSPLSKGRIRRMLKKKNIDLDEYQEKKYKSFNDFFMRKKKNPLKRLNENKNLFLSPADSRVTVYKIDDDLCLNIKNSKYTVSELLQDEKLAKKYQGGYCFVYRLCVEDYHHYYYIDDAKVIGNKKIDGILHTVQPIAFKKYKVFCENAREYNILRTKNFGDIVQMEIGALLVGKICNLEVDEVKRGSEKGHFEFGGSTIVILVEKNRVKVDEDIMEHSHNEIETKISLLEAVGRKM